MENSNTVQVKVMVTVNCNSIWGDDCTIGQIKKQASEEAIDLATRALHRDPRVKAVKAEDVIFSGVI